ncbi:class I glutamine amidotransferase-like protein [Mycena floridula]|nr:class I glutamine amidotransferase-like protein [Mycena floridula]
MPSILFVFSSADKNLVGNPRWLLSARRSAFAAHPYYIFSPSCEIDFASPKGIFRSIPPALKSLWAKDKECIDFLKDQTVKAKFAEAKTLAKYNVIFYPGGHAPSFTGFSNAEEKAVNAVATIPFLLEDKITALGGKYEKAADLFGVKVVVDGNLYTGQNPNSAGPLAKEILVALNK